MVWIWLPEFIIDMFIVEFLSNNIGWIPLIAVAFLLLLLLIAVNS